MVDTGKDFALGFDSKTIKSIDDLTKAAGIYREAFKAQGAQLNQFKKLFRKGSNMNFHKDSHKQAMGVGLDKLSAIMTKSTKLNETNNANLVKELKKLHMSLAPAGVKGSAGLAERLFMSNQSRVTNVFSRKYPSLTEQNVDTSSRSNPGYTSKSRTPSLLSSLIKNAEFNGSSGGVSPEDLGNNAYESSSSIISKYIRKQTVDKFKPWMKDKRAKYNDVKGSLRDVNPISRALRGEQGLESPSYVKAFGGLKNNISKLFGGGKGTGGSSGEDETEKKKKGLGFFTKAGIIGIGGMIGKKLFDSSPMLQAMMKLFNTAMTLFLRPIGDFIGGMLRPLVFFFLKNIAIPMAKQGKGMMNLGEKIGKGLLGFFLKPGESIKQAILTAIIPLWTSWMNFVAPSGRFDKSLNEGEGAFRPWEDKDNSQFGWAQNYDPIKDWKIDRMLEMEKGKDIPDQDEIEMWERAKEWMHMGNLTKDIVDSITFDDFNDGLGMFGITVTNTGKTLDELTESAEKATDALLGIGKKEMTPLEKEIAISKELHPEWFDGRGGKGGVNIGNFMDQFGEEGSDAYNEAQEFAKNIAKMKLDSELSAQETNMLLNYFISAKKHGIGTAQILNDIGDIITDARDELAERLRSLIGQQITARTTYGLYGQTGKADSDLVQTNNSLNAGGGSFSGGGSETSGGKMATASEIYALQKKYKKITGEWLVIPSGTMTRDRLNSLNKYLDDYIAHDKTNAYNTNTGNARDTAAAGGSTGYDEDKNGDGVVDWQDYTGMAKGGVISEPIFGIGAQTGQKYKFGEAGREIITPEGKSSGGTIYNVININIGNVSKEADYTKLKPLIQRWLLESNSRRGIL
jgi:hypothetical protein